MVTKLNIKKKFLGTMLGAALGDAIGEAIGDLREGQLGVDEYQIEGLVRLMPLLRYTDDTHMTIGVAESLVEHKGFNGAHMAQCFIGNYSKEPWRGYAFGPPRVFQLIKNGKPWDKAAANIYSNGSFGNGAAMRVSPIGLFLWDRHAQLVETVYHSSRITHHHALGIEGATLQAIAVALAIAENPNKAFDVSAFTAQLLSYTTQNIYCMKIAKFETLLKHPTDKQEVIEQLGHGVEAFNSVPTAIFAFLCNPQSFASAVAFAISLGGDTDTIASMAGAISGAYLGIDSIPAEWQGHLENQDYISKLAQRLYRTSLTQ